MQKIEICARCKATNISSLVPKIRKLLPDVEIQIHCIQFCGIGRDKVVVLFNQFPVIGKDEDEVIQKLQEMIMKK